MRLRKYEYYTEYRGAIEVIEHIKGNLYQTTQRPFKRLIRVSSEVFKNKQEAKKYFES
jgi:hypothetical protein